MNEFELISSVFACDNLSWTSPLIDTAIGDDCAVISVPSGHNLCLSMDTLIESVHFPAGATGFDVGCRALCVTLSDLAAMGAIPMGFTLAISAPEIDLSWIRQFALGMSHIAKKFNCPLIGGDTTKGAQLTLTIQVHGITPKGTALKRSGARIGDQVCVVASDDRGLGEGAKALMHVLEDPLLNTEKTRYFWRPLPQLAMGKSLIGSATSCIDISDGLIQDLNHICRASGVGMTVDADLLPITPRVAEGLDHGAVIRLALSGGDDYQLAFTVPAEVSVPSGCVKIGSVEKGNSVRLINYIEEIVEEGYQHFR